MLIRTMMVVGRLVRTLSHLKLTQLYHQLKSRVSHKSLIVKSCQTLPNSLILEDFIERPHSNRYHRGIMCFEFLNMVQNVSSWNDNNFGMLWAYNLNYMDYLLQPNLPFEIGMDHIRKFIDEIDSNRVGLDPYPTALRCINWIKWITIHGHKIEDWEKEKISNSLFAQYMLLERQLEWHLMGNHLLEDACSLVIGALYFCDKSMWRKASKLLLSQIKEQTLPDGAHFEQSPMYHCILLDRLLDVYNAIKNNNTFGTEQNEVKNAVEMCTVRMLGHLESVTWRDDTIPLLNDSAYGIAPTPTQIKYYAERLGLSWTPITLGESGYRKFISDRIEAIVDIGNITASYQPGHTHADTFSYELRIDGRPFIVDTGISTYNKTPRRQYERSTCAHNTVTIDDADSSEVWSGFRVGRRAKVTLLCDDKTRVEASHNGFGHKKHLRSFAHKTDTFAIHDTINTASAISRIHFAPEVDNIKISDTKIETDIATISIEGATAISLKDEQISRVYNRLMPIKVAEICFSKEMTYKIVPKVKK